MKYVAQDLGISTGGVRLWVRQDRIDRGEISGTSTTESAALARARERVHDLQRELESSTPRPRAEQRHHLCGGLRTLTAGHIATRVVPEGTVVLGSLDWCGNRNLLTRSARTKGKRLKPGPRTNSSAKGLNLFHVG